MPSESIRHKFPFNLLIIFLLLAAGIAIAGYFYYEQQKSLLKADAENNIVSIADLKVQQIMKWRRERIGDAAVLSDNPFIARAVQILSEGKNGSESKQAILSVLRSLQKHSGYRDIFLLDAGGKTVLSLSDSTEKIGPYAKRLAAESVSTKQIILSDFHRGVYIRDIHIDMFAPVFAGKGSPSHVSGIFFFRIDPAEFLFLLIQSWPTPSKSAETLLVRKDNNDVLFINELRHKKDTALNFRIPLNGKELPAAMALRGVGGVVEGKDYRNVPVLAAIRPVPDTPWFLISKIDKSEVYTVLRKRAAFISIVVAVLMLACGLGVLLIWRHNTAEFYRKEYEAEHERQLYAKRYEHLTKNANDIILLTEKNGNIADVNERAVDTYGYTLEEMLHLNLRDLRSPETKILLNGQLKEVEAHNGMVFETQHQSKDGTVFPVEVSSRIMSINGKQYYQSIIRDITERKKAEEEFKRNESRMLALLELNRMIESTLQDVTGFALEEAIQKKLSI